MGQCVSGQREGCDGSAACSEKHGCLAVVKERRSRLYIARKCVVMLLCWHKYGIGKGAPSRSLRSLKQKTKENYNEDKQKNYEGQSSLISNKPS